MSQENGHQYIDLREGFAGGTPSPELGPTEQHSIEGTKVGSSPMISRNNLSIATVPVGIQAFRQQNNPIKSLLKRSTRISIGSSAQNVY